MAIGISDARARQVSEGLSEIPRSTPAGASARAAYPAKRTVLNPDSTATDLLDIGPPSEFGIDM